MILSAVGGAGALWSLWQRRHRLARIFAVVAVASVVAGWGAAQYPWILVDEARLLDVAGARPTLWGLVITFGLAAVTVVPALVYLLRLTQTEEWTA